jgi:signal recognition particle subunit SRP19
MRKKNKIFLWSIYFDADKTRSDGRRVPKNLAISSPKLDELQRATKRIGLHPEVVSDASHPSYPWRRTGLLIIPKIEEKGKTLKKIAKELYDLRK